MSKGNAEAEPKEQFSFGAANGTTTAEDEGRSGSLEDLLPGDDARIKGGRFHDNGLKVYVDVVYNHTAE